MDPEFLRPRLGGYYLLALSSIIIIILILYFVILKVDPSQYIEYLLQLNADSTNQALLQLNNANTISNLPDVALQTNNSDISEMVNCKNTLKYMGPIIDNLENYRTLCKNTCGGAGELLVIESPRDYIYNNEYVQPGVYCTVAPTKCNLKTGYAVATINSVVCKSKFPRMFGGKQATDILACNDAKYPSTGSILWDYANNEEVDPNTVNITHEDETLPDGSFRFRCKFNETEMGNPYIAHPIDRFHPIADVCNKTIYRADYSVHAKVDESGWSCDCGNFSDTRVSHLDSSNPQSTCTSCFPEKNDSNNIYKIPYLCYKETSPHRLATTMSPCLEYVGAGNYCQKLELNIKLKEKEELFINTETPNLDQNQLSTEYEI
ncbi:PIF-2 [Penaeus vannamei nudivirus]|nr:PIF-2 [Penaeus vannamei nucleopolyhedrovirus]